MPIPILKMKPVKRVSEEGKIPMGVTRTPASPRGIVKNTNTSHIPSPGLQRDTKSRIATSTPKNTRPGTGIKQSPRPPLRTSGTNDQRNKVSKLNTTSREPMYAKNKIVAPKRYEYTGVTGRNQTTTNSNRSSVISNCSSIPPPSSSSSNRNSNSSISSNFSVGSWNSNNAGTLDSPTELFPISGSDTFPRTNTNKLRPPDESLTKSMEETIRSKPRGSLPRPTNHQRIPTSTTRKQNISGKQLSSSETAIPNRSRIVLPVSNYSETNLSNIGGLKSRTDKTMKPMAAVRGKSKSRSATPDKDTKIYKDKVALVAPYSRSDNKDSSYARGTSNEEDDGYSSVANNDMNDDIFKKPTKIIEDDYDEVPDIEPMKPLLVTKCYDLLKEKRDAEKPAKHIPKLTSPTKLKSQKKDTSLQPNNNLEQKPIIKKPNTISRQSSGDIPSIRKPFQLSTSSEKLEMGNSSKIQTESSVDDSALAFSYKDFVKRNPEERTGYNWMSINTIDMKLPKEPRRKLLFSEIPSPGSIPVPTPTPPPTYEKTSPNIRKSDMPQRPSSLHTDKLFAGKSNDTFQRTGSLRSPSLDSTPETKILSFNSSPAPRRYGGNSPSFNRGAYKYSTVIPRTNNETYDSRDSAYSSGSPSDCKVLEVVSPQMDQSEVHRLRSELTNSRETIRSLKEQLASSNKLVTAYEHSLTNMTHRLQQLSKVTEEKEMEINELKRLLERSCTESNAANMKSNTIGGINRGISVESLTSLMSTDSAASSISTTSTISNASNIDSETREKHKRKSWIRSSFSKAFKRKNKRRDSVTDNESNGYFSRQVSENDSMKGYCSLPSSPLPHRVQTTKTEAINYPENPLAFALDEVTRLRITIQEKESALTESRLESLSSAHQIEALKESIHKLSTELTCIRSKQRNTAITNTISQKPITKTIKIILSIGNDNNQWLDNMEITSTTSWKQFDEILHRTMMTYWNVIDPDLQLSLTSDSIYQYQIGEITRRLENIPEFLPYGYLIGEVDSVNITLKSLDLLALQSCLPKSNLEHYLSYLKDYRRVILAGPQGTCKSYLTSKMAHLIIQRLGVKPSAGNIARFQVTSDNEHDLSAYLSHVSDLCDSKSSDLPLVIVLENLEKVENLPKMLSSLRTTHDQCPYIIGNIRMSKNAKDSVKLSNSFKWIFLDPELEPLNDLLSRLCRYQKLLNRKNSESNDLNSFLDWLPRCWKRINAVLNGTSVEILGPSIFLPIATTSTEAKHNFNQTWNSALLPLIQKAAQDTTFIPQDVQTWNDLGKCLSEELPWTSFEDLKEIPRPFQ